MAEFSVCFDCTLVITVKASDVDEAIKIASEKIDGIESVVTNFLQENESTRSMLPALYVEKAFKVINEETGEETLL